MLSLREVTIALPAVEDPKDVFRPVEGFSLEMAPGEILGLAGPSGCGKTVLCSALLGLLDPPGRVEAGRALFTRAGGEVVDLASLPERAFEGLRGREISMIFQDPAGSLNPSRTIERQFAAVVRAHNEKVGRAECRALALEWLAKMQLEDPERVLKSYPFELSGGMCQRVAVAMAMVHGPRLLLADEPTTALDVKNQAALLRLLAGLREETGAGILLVSHDERALAAVADRVMRMG